jgi:excisionase family DNA binding protein
MLQVIAEKSIQEVFSVKKAAEKLCLSVPYIRNEIRDGNLKAKKVGRRVLVTSTALQQYLDNQPDWSPAAQNGEKK